MEIFTFKDAMGREGCCGLDIVKHKVHYVIVLTELIKNTGPSVTNACEEIATQVCNKKDIVPGRTVWVEIYENHPGLASIVTFKWDEKDCEFCSPSWRDLDQNEASELELTHLLG